MKGIVLAGGTGSRLWPITKVASKQLLPVYDKPMIYYPLATLMLAGIREVLIITTPQDNASFRELLGDGSKLGMKLVYEVQPCPEGLAQAFIIGEKFLAKDSCLLILGDNIFHGTGLGNRLEHTLPTSGSHIFTYEVAEPEQYGVLTLDGFGNPSKIQEKPKNSDSNLAVTGLYFFDSQVVEVAKNVKPSQRGELEITSVIEWYLNEKSLTFTKLNRGTAWLDTGNPKSLHDAATFIRVIEERTGLKIACLEEIAFRNKWITAQAFESLISQYGNSEYASYLKKVFLNSNAEEL